jgi:hypothetical protein
MEYDKKSARKSKNVFEKNKNIQLIYIENKMSNSELLGGSNRSLLKNGNLVINGYGSSKSTTTGSLALGFDCGKFNQESNCVAIGSSCGVSGQKQGGVSIGSNSGVQNSATNSVCIGNTCGVSDAGANSVQIGNNCGATDSGDNSVAIGNGNLNTGDNCISIGLNNQGGYLLDNILIGKNCEVTANASVAMGISCKSAGGVALGNTCDAQSGGSIAIGNNAVARGNSVICLAGTPLTTASGINDAFFVRPIRGVALGIGVGRMVYSPASGEITYSTT